jgi:hypothetical protein
MLSNNLKNVRIQIVVIRKLHCFVLKGAENLPAHGLKTEKIHYFGVIYILIYCNYIYRE